MTARQPALGMHPAPNFIPVIDARDPSAHAPRSAASLVVPGGYGAPMITYGSS